MTEPEPAIDVAFLPGEIRSTELAVVVDVLRASTTIAAALSAGYSRVLCVDDAKRAEDLREPGRALAGERDCRPIEGFDYGNSPGGLDPGEGRELVITTSNGSPAILAAAAEADEVVVGSLVNLDAVIEAIAPASHVTIVCCGTAGRVALEDLYGAGRIVARLQGERSDGARAAERLAGAYPEAYEALAESADAAVLRRTDQEDDIAFCARESVIEVVPRVSDVSDGIATVSNWVYAENDKQAVATAQASDAQGKA